MTGSKSVIDNNKLIDQFVILKRNSLILIVITKKLLKIYSLSFENHLVKFRKAI